jgi:hypothetical protein
MPTKVRAKAGCRARPALVCGTATSDGMFADMAVTVEMHNTGDPERRADVIAHIEHVLADRPGDWRVSIVGSQANDRWEMKITGPNGFERSCTLEGTAGQHEPDAIRIIVGKMVSKDQSPAASWGLVDQCFRIL